MTPLAELQKKKKAPRKTGRAKMLKKRAPVPTKGDFSLAIDCESDQPANPAPVLTQKEKEEKELRDFVNGF